MREPGPAALWGPSSSPPCLSCVYVSPFPWGELSGRLLVWKWQVGPVTRDRGSVTSSRGEGLLSKGHSGRSRPLSFPGGSGGQAGAALGPARPGRWHRGCSAPSRHLSAHSEPLGSGPGRGSPAGAAGFLPFPSSGASPRAEQTQMTPQLQLAPRCWGSGAQGGGRLAPACPGSRAGDPRSLTTADRGGLRAAGAPVKGAADTGGAGELGARVCPRHPGHGGSAARIEGHGSSRAPGSGWSRVSVVSYLSGLLSLAWGASVFVDELSELDVFGFFRTFIFKMVLPCCPLLSFKPGM